MTNPNKLECKKCHYNWRPALENRLPVVCPSCNSRKWNGEKIIER